MKKEKVLKKCPLCGAKIVYNQLMQFSAEYELLKNGNLSKRRKRKSGEESIDCGFLSCTNQLCDFVTDTEYQIEKHNDIEIINIGGRFFIREDSEEKENESN